MPINKKNINPIRHHYNHHNHDNNNNNDKNIINPFLRNVPIRNINYDYNYDIKNFIKFKLNQYTLMNYTDINTNYYQQKSPMILFYIYNII